MQEIKLLPLAFLIVYSHCYNKNIKIVAKAINIIAPVKQIILFFLSLYLLRRLLF